MNSQKRKNYLFSPLKEINIPVSHYCCVLPCMHISQTSYFIVLYDTAFRITDNQLLW